MCVTDKFFFCVPLDIGCLILGFCSFVLGTFMALSSTALLIMENTDPGKALSMLQSFPELVMNKASVNVILVMVAVLAWLWMLFSVVLVVGIRKNKSSFVLWYFSFGIMLTILGFLSALLVLLEKHWILALVQTIISLIYTHCLVVVHTTYDLMQTGTVFKFSYQVQSDESDETILVNSTDDDY